MYIIAEKLISIKDRQFLQSYGISQVVQTSAAS
jgi:hypothetical protein